MPAHCTECGAPLSDGNTCQSIFDEFLSLEFSDPGYGQVHFLTVACFMVQHNRYSDEGLIWIRSKLQSYLLGELTVQQIRQSAAQDANKATRSWKVTRSADAPPLPKVRWPMTIMDVAHNFRDANSYCEQIQRWAQTTLETMQTPSH